MIDPVIRWSEVMQYRNKKLITITKLVETMWLIHYPWLVDITYEVVRELLHQKFKNILIENEYSIKTKPASPGNP